MSHPKAKFHGERLKELREKRQLYQKSFAFYIGVSRSTYSKYEQEKIPLPIDRLPIIADYLNVDPNYLIGVIDYPLPYPKNTVININQNNLLNSTNNEGIIMDKKIHFNEETAALLAESLPKDYAEKVFALLEEKEAFQAYLPPEFSKTFDLIDTHNEGLKILENNAHFLAGFKWGVQLIMSTFVADVSDTSD